MKRYFRKVIRISAIDSPNVRYGLAQKAAGKEPTDDLLIPGVLPYSIYAKRRATWDKIRQCIGLDGLFYEGAEIKLFPPEWIAAAGMPSLVSLCRQYPAEAIGVDPAEGSDKTAMAAVNRYGVKELVSRQTPNTDDIPREAKAFAIKHNIPPHMIVFDRGGGGKQHADRMRAENWDVRTVAFGETLIQDPKRGLVTLSEKMESREQRYAFVNRRAEMYGTLRIYIDPTDGTDVQSGIWAIPPEYQELIHQMSVIPLLYDAEGRLRLPPKTRKDPNQKIVTLVDLIGHSPDECDAVVLGIHALEYRSLQAVAGAI